MQLGVLIGQRLRLEQRQFGVDAWRLVAGLFPSVIHPLIGVGAFQVVLKVVYVSVGRMAYV